MYPWKEWKYHSLLLSYAYSQIDSKVLLIWSWYAYAVIWDHSCLVRLKQFEISVTGKSVTYVVYQPKKWKLAVMRKIANNWPI